MIQSYKCPNCGAFLVYKEGTKKMQCPYCSSMVSIEEAARKAEEDSRREREREQEAAGQGREAGAVDTSGDGTATFHCESCGGELVTDRFTAATICPYCGSPSIIKSRLEGENRPNVLIPFVIGREQAKEEFRKWAGSGILTPRGFFSETALDQITGLYVPYWLFDLHSGAYLEASATRIRTEIRGDYEYTYTDHYHLMRDTEADFRRIPADASEEMPDDTMERLEPFDYEKICDFEIPYLSGYMAECSNFQPSALQPRVEERAGQYMYNAAYATMAGYSTVNVLKSNIQNHKTGQEYAMFPVWILQYNYKGKNWKLYLNGETGRRIGTLPVDPLRAFLFFLAVSAGSFAAAALIWFLVLHLI